MKIERATPSDIGAIVAINRQLDYLSGIIWSRRYHIEEKIGLGLYHVARDCGKAIGAMFLGVDLPYRHGEAHIFSLAVDPRNQRAGAGRLLVDEALSLAKAANKKKLVVESAHGFDARGFYEKCGFILVKEPMRHFVSPSYRFEIDLKGN